jgi:hypothetical protein
MLCLLLECMIIFESQAIFWPYAQILRSLYKKKMSKCTLELEENLFVLENMSSKCNSV